MLGHRVAFVKQINGYFERDSFASKKHQRVRKNPKKKNKDYNRLRGLIKIRTDGIYKIFGMLKKDKVHHSQRWLLTRERDILRDSITIRTKTGLVTLTLSKKINFFELDFL